MPASVSLIAWLKQAGLARLFAIVETAVARRNDYLAATARLAADVTALSEAATMLESMPTPQRTRPWLVSA
jgi:hypothetical protein